MCTSVHHAVSTSVCLSVCLSVCYSQKLSNVVKFQQTFSKCGTHVTEYIVNTKLALMQEHVSEPARHTNFLFSVKFPILSIKSYLFFKPVCTKFEIQTTYEICKTNIVPRNEECTTRHVTKMLLNKTLSYWLSYKSLSISTVNNKTRSYQVTLLMQHIASVKMLTSNVTFHDCCCSSHH